MNPLRKNLTCLGLGKGAVGTRLHMTRMIAQATCFGLIATLLSGCMTKRSSYDVPEIPLPDQYKNSSTKKVPTSSSKTAEASVKAITHNAPQDVGLVEWWRSFGNSELVELIDRGLANNPDVRIATQQMAQAKTRVDQARAGQLPTLSAPIQFANQAPGGSIGIVNPGQGPGSQKTYQASLQGNWRADLWGERSSLAESAKFQMWQAAFNRDNIQRNMVASLAASYVDYLSVNDRLRVARETDAVLSRMLTSVEKRVAVGDATLIELDQQKASIFSIRATIPTLEQQREDALTTIAFLVGSVPGSLKLSNDGLDALFLPTVIPALPSSLLLRRPDVRMAEARLLSADADIDVARARLLPPLDLSAQVGHSSLALSQFFSPSTLFWNAISNLTVSIFDGGKQKSDKENAQAIHEEMVETYARTIYQAAREVESALAGIRLTANRLASQQEATTSARLAWDTSAKVYAVGGLDYQSLLDAERNYHNYLNQYLQVKADTYHGYITLFQALGGGVNFVKQLPGNGIRPTSVQTVSLGSAIHSASTKSPEVSAKVISTEGVDWDSWNSSTIEGSLHVEKFWQVELPGLYHRSTIGATWRDLRTRYPKLMENHIVRPRLDGNKENSTDDQMSLFRLYVSKFATPEAAHELCAALKANLQRCRVVSSRSDEEVPEPALPTKGKEPSPATITPKIAEQTNGKLDAKFDTAMSSLPKSPAESTSHPVKSIFTGTGEIYAKQDNAKDKLAYTVQLGAFSNLENAAVSHALWRARKYDVFVSEIKDTEDEIRYVVRTGVFQTKSDASALVLLLKRKEDVSVKVVQTTVDNTGTPDSIDMSKLPPHSQKTISLIASGSSGMQKTKLPDNARESIALHNEGTAKPAYSVQLGAFSTEENAVKSQEQWQSRGFKAYICEIKDTANRTRYAVRTGLFTQPREASVIMRALKRKAGFRATLVTTVVGNADKPVVNDSHLSEMKIEAAFHRPA